MPEKVLFITNKLRPNRGPEALQSTLIAKHLSKHCKVHVLSTTRDPVETGLSIQHHVPKKGFSPLKSRIENTYAKLGKNLKLCFPDPSAGWVEDAILKASGIMATEDINIIITRSMPASTHMIGLAMKRQHPRARWIASLSDPISINPYQDFISKGLKKRLVEYERDIFNEADTITHTNTFALQTYNKIYPRLTDKQIVLSNMFERQNVEKSRHLKLKSGPMILSYAGRFYGQRNPEALFKAIQLFIKKNGKESIRFDIIGAGISRRLSTLVHKYHLGDSIRQFPFLEKEELAKQLSASHMLVSIDGDFPGINIFSPSKNFDYLSLTVPILGITRKGSTAALIEETGSGFWAEPGDSRGICKILQEHQVRLREGYEFTPNHDRVMDYHADNEIKRFYNLVLK